MPEVKSIISIENVVASATVRQDVNLNSVVKAFPHVEYRPEQFSGLVFRLKKPKTATLARALRRGSGLRRDGITQNTVFSP